MISEQKKVIPLLRTAVSTLIENRAILFPFSIIVFVQLFLLEIAYFSVRFPLNVFFGPLIRHFWSEKYLHFPYNFIVLPRIFQNSFIQAMIYVFVSAFFIGCAILMIENINKGKSLRFKKIIKDVAPYYFHIVLLAIISVLLIKGLFLITGALSERALLIRSTTGPFYLLRKMVLVFGPYLNLIFSVLITTLFAYVLPIIVIEKKKIFSAIALNFKILFKSFWFTFVIVLIPVLFLIPVILLRNSFSGTLFIPELTVFILILSTLVMVLIDAVVYTTVTIYYLLLRED